MSGPIPAVGDGDGVRPAGQPEGGDAVGSSGGVLSGAASMGDGVGGEAASAGAIVRAPDRDDHGRFLPGNRAAVGNPMARRVQRLRVAMLRALRPVDLPDVTRAMVDAAKAGDVAAARLLLDYTVGRPPQAAPLADLNADASRDRVYTVTFDRPLP